MNEATYIYPRDGSPREPLTRDKVILHFDASLRRITNPIIESQIEVVWNKLVREQESQGLVAPFDGSKFRLHKVEFNDDVINITLGGSSYREYLAFRGSTQIADEAYALCRATESDIRDCLPRVLGNAVVALTEDLKLAVVQRNQSVSTYRGYLDLPGGHPEPSQICDAWQGVPKDAFQVDLATKNELFDSAVLEASEDLRLDVNHFTNPSLLAIVENLSNLFKPDILFACQVPLLARRAKELFQGRSSGGREVDEVFFIDPFSRVPLPTGCEVTPVLSAAIELLGRTNRFAFPAQS